MSANGELNLTVHGLAVDNGNVRADVFLEKFKAVLGALKEADKFVNSKTAHDYLVVGLETASAHAVLRERVIAKKIVPVSSVNFVKDVVESIYNGDRNISRFPQKIISAISPVVRGVGKTFSHAEIEFPGNNVVRIDDYLAKQIDRAAKRIVGEETCVDKNFEGIAFETFDGIVKELDARGTLVRGKLILTVGGKEIDCIFRHSDIDVLRRSFDRRARINVVAHYDGISLLPVRADVKGITIIEPGNGLEKWKGALSCKSGSGGLGE